MLKKNLVQQIDAKSKVDLLILTGRLVDQPGIPVDMLVIGEMAERTCKNCWLSLKRKWDKR